MKGGTVQIAWHGSEPVLSLDFHSLSGLLATAGADHDIKLWSVHQKENAAPTVNFEADLCYHSKAVNVLRFSPSGQLLASGGDGGEILIWRPVESVENKPSWKVLRTLQLHLRDVLDLAWSPDGMSLMSGSVDNQCIIWDVSTGKVKQILNEHLHFVQGVAWDPAGQFLASISADRTCRIYSCQSAPTSKKQKNGLEKSLYSCQQVLAKTDAPPSKSTAKPETDAGPSSSTAKPDADSSTLKSAATKQHLFHDETLPSFFRRLAWSPDGSFLVVPSGVHKILQESAPCNVSYVLSRTDLSRPAIHVPAPSKPVVAVRFCPVIFSLQRNEAEEDSSSSGSFQLPYRLVFAVATLDSLFIYDTQHNSPIVIFAGLHYAAITDIAWSADAQYVAVSSQDGYCTLLVFSDNELGVRLPCSELAPHIASYLQETLIAKGKAGPTAASNEVLPNTESLGPSSQEQGSPTASCPRPLKHRRITPTALPGVSSPSPAKHRRITPTAITACSPPMSQHQRRITLTALSADSPSSSRAYHDIPPSTASDASPSSFQNRLAATPIIVLADSPLNARNSNLCESSPTPGGSPSSPQKRRRIVPTPLHMDAPSSHLSSTDADSPPRPLNSNQVLSTAFPVHMESCLQEQFSIAPISTSAESPIRPQEPCPFITTTLPAEQPLTPQKCLPMAANEVTVSQPLPAPKQRRITPIAVPSESPSNLLSCYASSSAVHSTEAPSSPGLGLPASPTSRRRESGLDFEIELNPMAMAESK